MVGAGPFLVEGLERKYNMKFVKLNVKNKIIVLWVLELSSYFMLVSKKMSFYRHCMVYFVFRVKNTHPSWRKS